MQRRRFLQLVSAIGASGVRGEDSFERSARTPAPFRASELVERQAVVTRHAPVVRSVDPLSVLSVGNGSFVFTADATGLQTFPDAYREIPLATQAEWGWHSFPNPEGYTLADAATAYATEAGEKPYADQQHSPAGQWLRQNPHRLSLARIGLDLRTPEGSVAAAHDLQEVEQRLELWTGTLKSRFRIGEARVHVTTCAHPRHDVLAFRIEVEGTRAHVPPVTIAFPYGATVHTGDPAVWSQQERHRTEIVASGATHAEWARALDEDRYSVRSRWSDGGRLERTDKHEFRLRIRPEYTSVELVLAFSPQPTAQRLPLAAEVFTDAGNHWPRFWSTGGAIDLAGSTHPQANELERRIVLSQYLTAIQCAGRMPPQETGLTFNSWHGKFHLEMHWWHAVHFALWDRLDLLERSLPWYQSILPVARQTARSQGYAGVRWPKMVGADGRESPSTIGVFLIWQQPHPIYYAELVYRARPEHEVLEAYREVVFETAEFLASYPTWNQSRGHYVLGPPLIPAQEIHPPRTTVNPTFELAYWRFGMETAQRWRERLGLQRDEAWDRVLAYLSPLPMKDGLYVNAESDPNTFTDATMRRDHPTLLAPYGMLESSEVDRSAMLGTLHRVISDWQWDETWGWDYPLVAMTAARLGAPEIAIDALLMDAPKNRYLPNGHNHQGPELTIYLPGNGGLLSAVAMMAAGWEGGPEHRAPGFPPDRWNVRFEGVKKML